MSAVARACVASHINMQRTNEQKKRAERMTAAGLGLERSRFRGFCTPRVMCAGEGGRVLCLVTTQTPGWNG
eukprot:350037-Pyramimonas_sp.AAC.1